MAVTTERGQDHQIQIDGQAVSPGLPSLREAIARTYAAAVCLSHLPGFPQPGAEIAEEEDLEPEPEPEEEEEEEDDAEHTNRENEIVSGGVGIITTLLANGLHRVQKVQRVAPAAIAGVIRTGDTLTRVDNMILKNVQSEAVMVLLTGPPESEVELELSSANGIPTVVTLRRAALCLNSVG